MPSDMKGCGSFAQEINFLIDLRHTNLGHIRDASSCHGLCQRI